TAMLFWWHVLAAAPRIHRYTTPWMRIGLVVLALIPNQILAVIITMSGDVMYAYYANAPRITGISPIEDQQIGGIIMWIPGSMMYALIALFLISRGHAPHESLRGSPRAHALGRAPYLPGTRAGEVEVQVRKPDEADFSAKHRMTAGEIIGLVALVDGGPRSATCTAKGDIFTFDSASGVNKKTVGANDAFIRANSADTIGWEWLKISALTEETAPVAGDWVLGEESGGAMRKFDVGSKNELREVLAGWDFGEWLEAQDLWTDMASSSATSL
ncbi:MAG: cytochrome c oxidase assembly protein, partial [Pseudomonadota bacterium]